MSFHKQFRPDSFSNSGFLFCGSFFLNLSILFPSHLFNCAMSISQLLIPYRSTILKTTLSEQEINKRILKNTTIVDSLYFSFDGANKNFKGIRTTNGYRLRRSILYKNSFLPTIDLTIADDVLVRSIVLKMWIPWVILAVMGIILFIVSIINFPQKPWFDNFIPLLMYFVILLAFHIEARIALNRLKNILQLNN